MDFGKLRQLMDQMPAYGIPASEIAVTWHGKEVFRHRAGFSDMARTKPVTEQDLYWIFSISKITACISGLRLVEEGKLRLDAPVSDYLPEYTDVQVLQADGTLRTPKSVMTVRHLFAMTCGMDYDLNSPALQRLRVRDPHFTAADLARALAEQPLHSDPGEHYCYSLSHDVLAGVVETVSGMRFEDYVRKIIWEPLGMRETGYHLPREYEKRLTGMYRYVNGVMRPDPMIPPVNDYILSDCHDCGGAGLYSTVNDQIRFLTVLANGGKTEDGYSLLRPETIALAQTAQLPESAKPDFVSTRMYGYSFGLCCRVHVDKFFSRSPSALGEFGWDGAGGSYALVDPANQVAIFFATEVRGCQYIYHTLHPLIRNFAYEGMGIGSWVDSY